MSPIRLAASLSGSGTTLPNLLRTGEDTIVIMMLPRVYYSLFMFAALAVFLLARWSQPRAAGVAALSWQQRLALTWAALVGGALGCKIGFALATGGSWLEAGTWITDGKTITTGLVGAYLGVELAKRILCIHVKTGDGYALPLALALAVGRWGCFFNGCCHGLPTDLPWGVDFGDGQSCHPTQIYEFVFHLTLAGLLIVIIWRGALRCQRLKFYLIAYGVYRFLSEWLRPEPIWAVGMTFYQFVSVLIVVGLAAQWWMDRKLTGEVEAAAPVTAEPVANP